MPSDTTDAYNYILTGPEIRALLHTSNTECRYIVSHINKLVGYLNNLGFKYADTELNAVKAKIEDIIRGSGERAKPTEDLATKLRIVIDSVHAVVRSQAQACKIIELDDSAVPAKLKDYVTNKTLSKVQALFFNETARSLETHAYRSAIVMGWNLIYDRIREWFFSDAAKLAAFNAEMAKIHRGGSPVYDRIANYSDFFDGPNEAKVIDLCQDAKIFGAKVHDDLRTWLRRRNEHAHASDKEPRVAKRVRLLNILLTFLQNWRFDPDSAIGGAKPINPIPCHCDSRWYIRCRRASRVVPLQAVLSQRPPGCVQWHAHGNAIAVEDDEFAERVFDSQEANVT